jgi:hypothetical protein
MQVDVPVGEMYRPRLTVRLADRGWARDDGDGIREFRGNAMEGLWAGLRNSPRPCRGVRKEYLHQYAALFERGRYAKCVVATFIRSWIRGKLDPSTRPYLRRGNEKSPAPNEGAGHSQGERRLLLDDSRTGVFGSASDLGDQLGLHSGMGRAVFDEIRSKARRVPA